MSLASVGAAVSSSAARASASRSLARSVSEIFGPSLAPSLAETGRPQEGAEATLARSVAQPVINVSKASPTDAIPALYG
jgi:hypothetical protein